MKSSLYLPIFEALAHETRFKVFTFIYRSGAMGVRPKDMIDKFGFDSGTLDFHLKKLVAAGLICLKNGCLRGVYCINAAMPQELIQFFDSASAHNDLPLFTPATVTAIARGSLH